ncbi:TetR family transcriptional regulator [Planococcus sp. CP5-4]|uniref:TetR/AcrR family transcriptional regulator n=1 Tax=unclassified Planococcus (in: firmicutes) TaxID=2662419 RepID=UPI001C2336A8|nr:MULTISPECIES: TetR/AcrR family transcriptional regulator [unclassified Planococcus (in: firmicutes)]MBU9675161.1 TetR family transcriptional regulator [Planococcus sp. CP5-4_YE]MBV0908879.1 TetR family transcriptional regulator [Planococcus sp. CP5-4_UN]MBW6063928.1 TetR family transcriptional regulator [Planococcus sp. CP5-4]
MPTPTTKRDDVLSSALTLFAERGFDATTIPMIANDAKVGAGTIYRYFDNKEMLVNTLFQHYVTLFREALEKDYPVEADIREQFHHLFQGMIRFTNEHDHALYFIKTHTSAYFLDANSREQFSDLLMIFETFFEEGKKHNDIRQLPSKALIALIFGSFLQLYQLVRAGELEATEELLTGVEESCWDAVRHHS